jgi:hypothetical protein
VFSIQLLFIPVTLLSASFTNMYLFTVILHEKLQVKISILEFIIFMSVIGLDNKIENLLFGSRRTSAWVIVYCMEVFKSCILSSLLCV